MVFDGFYIGYQFVLVIFVGELVCVVIFCCGVFVVVMVLCDGVIFVIGEIVGKGCIVVCVFGEIVIDVYDVVCWNVGVVGIDCQFCFVWVVQDCLGEIGFGYDCFLIGFLNLVCFFFVCYGYSYS